MNPNPQNQNLQEIIKALSQFGFNFFGNDENGTPLVKAPNGQIVPLDVAYRFVKEQIEKSQQNMSSGSIEQMPQAPQVKMESGTESSVEDNFENVDIKKPESKVENQTQVQQSQPSAPQPVTPPPVIKQSIALPLGDGFKPKSFDPSDVAQTLKFINDNKTQSDKTSNKWIAIQFEKFLNEIKAQADKK